MMSRPARLVALVLAAAAMPLAAAATEPANRHFPAGVSPAAGADPPFSSAVLSGDTLYVAGTTDVDPATRQPASDATAAARRVMDNVKRAVEGAGMTMDDLTWVQVFAADLKDYAAFNAVYRGYFKGQMPARAFIGANALLAGAHFEVMGIAVRGRRRQVESAPMRHR